MKAGGRATKLLRPPVICEHKPIVPAQAGGAQVASDPQSTPRAEAGSPPYRQIKLALDVHAADLIVVRMVDGAKPQPPQKMTPSRLLEWVLK
jgi:hypothetical protein